MRPTFVGKGIGPVRLILHYHICAIKQTETNGLARVELVKASKGACL